MISADPVSEAGAPDMPVSSRRVGLGVVIGSCLLVEMVRTQKKGTSGHAERPEVPFELSATAELLRSSLGLEGPPFVVAVEP